MFFRNITPQTVQNDPPMPQCTYTIRKDELNGQILKYARVGDQVVHVWECESGFIFFMDKLENRVQKINKIPKILFFGFYA